jgi:hypothetical protein
MTLIQVTVSGSVGKQVFPTTRTVKLCHTLLSPSGANATVKIRDGNASGEVVFFGRVLSAYGSRGFKTDHKFDKGMHVMVIGTNAQAYLVIE